MGHQAALSGFKVLYFNAVKMFSKLKMARADGTYVKELKKWIGDYKKVEEELSRSFEFRLYIENVGAIPAKNIDIESSFPKIFNFIQCEDEHYGKQSNVPKKPEPPKVIDKLELLGIKGSDYFPDIMQLNSPINQINPNGPWLAFDKDNDFIYLQISIKKLKHHGNDVFNCFATFSDIPEIKSFEVSVVITADNISKKKNFKVPVVLKKDGTI